MDLTDGTYQIAVIPGDGIGPDLVREGIKVLQVAADATPGLLLSFETHDMGAAFYQRTGIVCPPEAYDACRDATAIFKGPIGLPDVRYPDGTELNVDILFRIGLDLYANVRPIKLRLPDSPVLKGKRAGDIDYVVVRENTEGMYASWAGDVDKTKVATASGIVLREEVGVDTILITRRGTERVVRFACDLARRRPGAPLDRIHRVTCVDKSNVLKSYAFFRRVYDQVMADFPDLDRDYAYVDAMTQAMVIHPEGFDVIVAENMFGDILTDLASATVGSLGLGHSANIGDDHAMFEPVHGSAPDLAGKEMANPIGQILSGKMLLDWLGERYGDQNAMQAAGFIERAVQTVLDEGQVLPADLGGEAKTHEVGDAIAQHIAG